MKSLIFRMYANESIHLVSFIRIFFDNPSHVTENITSPLGLVKVILLNFVITT